MLKEIYCGKFIENGQIRPKLEFHKGVNTIVGIGGKGERSENSVGKSTLLMIIDFCFGGNAFLKSKAVEKIGEHTICFAFEFNGQSHYFIRTTKTSGMVFQCDQNYQNPQKYDLQDFKAWLKRQYHLDAIELSFRDIVNPYFRFYGEEKEISPKEILRTYKAQNGKDQVRSLEKLFEKYQFIKEKVERILNEENRQKIKTRASNLKVELAEFKKINEKEIEKEIAALTRQKEELLQNKNDHIPELDAQSAEKIAKLKGKHKILAAKRSRLLMRIENIENADFETIKPSKRTYDALLEFFPNADIRKIEEIDLFHEKLNQILSEEHQEALEMYEAELAATQTELERIERQISESVNDGEDFTTGFLMEFAGIQSKIEKLSALLDEASNRKIASIAFREDKKTLKTDERSLLNEIEDSINGELAKFSGIVLGKNHEGIRFHFSSNAKYSLGSVFDDGTGTDYTSMILFDLSVLKLTKLPALIHDSYLLSNIRGSRLANLIKIYSQASEKQIFLAIDETEKLPSDAASFINAEDVRVIQLYRGGGELYGSYWGSRA